MQVFFKDMEKRETQEDGYKQNIFMGHKKILPKAFRTSCVFEMLGKKEMPTIESQFIGTRNNEPYSETEC